jgi:hypothetical protein
MKIVVIALVAVGVAVGLGACNEGAEPAAPSTKVVDSATAAAPDTIKAISIDSVVRKGSGDTVK